LKHGSKELTEILQEFLGLIWINENMPDGWKIGIICPLHKKGDPMQCANYRGINLSYTTYKVFSNILYTQLQPYAEKSLVTINVVFDMENQPLIKYILYGKFLKKLASTILTLTIFSSTSEQHIVA
jgi:hypothetical protein